MSVNVDGLVLSAVPAETLGVAAAGNPGTSPPASAAIVPSRRRRFGDTQHMQSMSLSPLFVFLHCVYPCFTAPSSQSTSWFPYKARSRAARLEVSVIEKKNTPANATSIENSAGYSYG